jgi:hypothetical protein
MLPLTFENSYHGKDYTRDFGFTAKKKKLAYKPGMNWEKQEVIRWKIKWLSETL